MKHKIRVHKGSYRYTSDRWYVQCLNPGCAEIMPPVDGSGMVGRPTWDAAFAVGVAHQKNVDVAFPGGAKWPARESHSPHECDSRCQ